MSIIYMWLKAKKNYKYIKIYNNEDLIRTVSYMNKLNFKQKSKIEPLIATSKEPDTHWHEFAVNPTYLNETCGKRKLWS